MATIEKRTHQNGSISYRVKIRLKGRPVQTATFQRITDAKKWATVTEAAIKEGRYFKTSESRKRTLGDAIDRYFRDVMKVNPKKNDVNQKKYLSWWNEQLSFS